MSTTIDKDLQEIYSVKAREMRHNFESAKKLQCPLTHPLFRSVIRDIINLDTPPELLAPLNKLAHTLVAEYDKDLNATIISKI